jgi:hypothetical protein
MMLPDILSRPSPGMLSYSSGLCSMLCLNTISFLITLRLTDTPCHICSVESNSDLQLTSLLLRPSWTVILTWGCLSMNLSELSLLTITNERLRSAEMASFRNSELCLLRKRPSPFSTISSLLALKHFGAPLSSGSPLSIRLPLIILRLAHLCSAAFRRRSLPFVTTTGIALLMLLPPLNSPVPIDPDGDVRFFRNAAPHPPHSVRVIVPSFLADEMMVRTALHSHGSTDEQAGWRLPIISEMDLHGGDQRENAFAKPLKSSKLDIYAFPGLSEEAKQKGITKEVHAEPQPFTFRVDIELGMLRTGAALNSPFKELLPGILETSADQMHMLRRLQTLRACSLVPAISDLLVEHGRDADFIAKIQLHHALGKFAQRFHKEIRAPARRHVKHNRGSLLTCSDILNTTARQLRQHHIEEVSPSSMRLAMITLLAMNSESWSSREIPSAIQPLNLQALEILRFEA